VSDEAVSGAFGGAASVSAPAPADVPAALAQPPSVDSEGRPELLVAGAFAGGLLAALLLRRLGADD
jgi:hypothetical protein